jgi:hypothetical protein
MLRKNDQSEGCIKQLQFFDWIMLKTGANSNILALSVPDEGYLRKALFALNLISTFLLICFAQNTMQI